MTKIDSHVAELSGLSLQLQLFQRAPASEKTRCGGGVLNNVTEVEVSEPARFDVFLHASLRENVLPSIRKNGLQPASRLATIDDKGRAFRQASSYDCNCIYFGKLGFFQRESYYNVTSDCFVYVLVKSDKPPMIDNDYSGPNGYAYCAPGGATPIHQANINTEIVSFTLPISSQDAIGLSRFIYGDADHSTQAYRKVQNLYNTEFSGLKFMHQFAFHFPDQMATASATTELSRQRHNTGSDTTALQFSPLNPAALSLFKHM